jgi:eukaryotic translation initiation factor 2C
LELCHIPPGQILRKQIPLDRTNSCLEFAQQRPRDRLTSITSGLGVRSGSTFLTDMLTFYPKVLDYNQSEYVRGFGMTVANEPIKIQARVLDPPTLMYHQSSEEPFVVRTFFPP